MSTLSGIGTGQGIAVGPARILPPHVNGGERLIATHAVDAELDRFDAAVVTTDTAMGEIGRRSQAPAAVGSDLVDTHRAILKSDELTLAARRLIRERSLAAEWAVRLVVDELQPVFAEMKDERFRERFEDVKAVASHLMRSLLKLPEVRLDERIRGGIVVGVELSPLDVLELHRLGVAGFAIERGGPTSHSAIVARALGVPGVFGVHGLGDDTHPGDTVCIDGASGEVVVRPDAPTIAAFELRRKAQAARFAAVEAVRLEPAITVDGTVLALGANVESAEEVAFAVREGADHIGLVRTELLYLDRRELPSEEEQLADAIEILHAAGGRPVTFRTLDIGGDKLPAGVRIAVGPNPALGLRGVRYSLREPLLFRTQLRALYRAAAVAPLRILLPLVSSVTEVRQARAICAEVCAELAANGVAHHPIAPIGAMIETPSAVLTIDDVAGACDFLSVGTNDLIQYAFAADRENEDMSYLYQPLHPAILRALDQVLRAAERADRPVSVCGDMAGDPAGAWMLLGLGLRSFSMTARALPFVKSTLRQATQSTTADVARRALRMTDAVEVAAIVHDAMEPSTQS